jgi:glutamate synthase (NADPH) small chain
MGKPTGFLEHRRELPPRRPVEMRIRDYDPVYLPIAEQKVVAQASRCMDCGIPFCQAGCPLGNAIPDWNDLVYHGNWRQAFERLRTTNNFPEFTGRICPAPCESACVLGITDSPVTIEQIEQEITERAYREGWAAPRPPAHRTGMHVAVIGSGPAGLAAADQLNQAGHLVTVYERDDRIGGLLRYGIPDFKLEKHVVDRRIGVMAAEGVHFETGAEIGGNVSTDVLASYDAAVLTGGSTRPRDLNVPGRSLPGIHFAWDYLRQQNKRVAGDELARDGIDEIVAAGKHVVVIGGGDTGSDCVGTAVRQGARSITQFEVLPRPPGERPAHHPWPLMPIVMTTTTSHEEGGERFWSVLTREFRGNGRVESLLTLDVTMTPANGAPPQLREVEGSERTWPADLVLLAIGYTGPEPNGMIAQLGLALDERGNVACDHRFMTSRPGIFAAGDMRRGQSLVVWAISEGREAARCVDEYLCGKTALPRKGPGDLPRVR